MVLFVFVGLFWFLIVGWGLLCLVWRVFGCCFASASMLDSVRIRMLTELPTTGLSAEIFFSSGIGSRLFVFWTLKAFLVVGWRLFGVG